MAKATKAAPTRTVYEVIGANIKAAREAADMKQVDFGRKLQARGFASLGAASSDSTVRQVAWTLEAGTRVFTAEDLIVIADVLETSVLELMAPRKSDKKVQLPIMAETLPVARYVKAWAGYTWGQMYEEAYETVRAEMWAHNREEILRIMKMNPDPATWFGALLEVLTEPSVEEAK